MSITPQKLETWFWRIFRLSLVILALPFVGMIIIFTKGFRDGGKALERARSLSIEERQIILNACVRIAGTIHEEYGELAFHDDLSGNHKAIPPEFSALQPMRVKVRKTDASIKLHFMVDSGVFIHVQGINTPTPTATLSWGEMGESESWISPASSGSPKP
jgi:hypothetical protein